MTPPGPAPEPPHAVRVWDLPTRLFHWLLLACIAGLFATAYVPGAPLAWHVRFGYAVLTLLLFRLAWGLVGGHWSRFASFLPPPAGTVRAGHSPWGSLAVAAMLLALLAQVGTGLVADDEIAFTGPLNRFVSNTAGLAATAWHKGAGQWLIVGLIGLHVAAIAYYLFVRRDNLVTAMVGGDKRLPRPARATEDTARTRLRALAILAACAGLVYAVAGAAG